MLPVEAEGVGDEIILCFGRGQELPPRNTRSAAHWRLPGPLGIIPGYPDWQTMEGR